MCQSESVANRQSKFPKFCDLCRKCMDGHTDETNNERNSLLNSIQAD